MTVLIEVKKFITNACPGFMIELANFRHELWPVYPAKAFVSSLYNTGGQIMLHIWKPEVDF